MGSIRLLVFAPLLGTAGFGALRLAITSSAIFSALAGLGLSTSFLRYLPETSSRGERAAFIRRVLGVSLATSCLVGLVLVLVPREMARVLFSDSEYWILSLLVAASLPLIVIYRSGLGAAGGIGRFDRAAIGETVQNLGYLMLGVGGLLLVSRRCEVAFGAFLVGMGAASAWLFPRIPLMHVSGDHSTAVRNKVDGLFRRSLVYSIWYALIPLFQYLFDFIDRWALAHFRDLSTTGAYSLVPILCGGMFVVGGALSPVVGRKGAELTARRRGLSAERLVWGSLGVAVIGSLGYSAALRVVEPVIWRIAGPKWETAATVVPLFLTYFTLFNLYYLFGSFAFFAEKTWVHLAALATGAMVNTGLNLLWVPSYGVEGAALATLVGLVAALGIQIAFVYSRGVRVIGRAWFAVVLAFVPLLPVIPLLGCTAVVLLLAWKSNLLLNDSDRRMVAGWTERILRRVRRGR